MMVAGGWLIGLFVLLIFLLLLGGLIAFIVWLARSGGRGELNRPRTPSGDQEDALEILRRRYARGEISREEFETMSDDLRS
jgi:putative membrane protein